MACMKRWPNDKSPWPNNLAPWPSDTPRSGLFYRTWEVKVGILCENGDAHSIKGGKTQKILSQLDIHRRCGSPNVSLLDVYLWEAGLLENGGILFPPSVIHSIHSKTPELHSKGFGYQVLPFGHHKIGEDDVGLVAPRHFPSFVGSVGCGFDVLYPAVSPPQQPFSRLASRIDGVFAQQKGSPFQQIVVFCRACRSLKLVPTKTAYECPDCHDDLVEQS